MRRWQMTVFALLAVFALACEGAEAGGGGGGPKPSGSTKPSGLPSSMAALGDSITAGFGTCVTLVACQRRSWSTGSDATVDSHYRRILDKNPKIKGRAHNYAESGADSAGLAAQARKAVRAEVGYVTVLIGANDACARTVDGMTGVRTFRKRVDAALKELRTGLPKARVMVVSIPDLYRLWQLGHDDPAAVETWERGICPSLLARPTSTADADEDRRREVDRRIDAYNRELAAACQAYGRKCKWDGGKVHGVRFSLDLVNRLDYFHPNTEGQRRLAEVTFPRRFNW